MRYRERRLDELRSHKHLGGLERIPLSSQTVIWLNTQKFSTVPTAWRTVVVAAHVSLSSGLDHPDLRGRRVGMSEPATCRS